MPQSAANDLEAAAAHDAAGRHDDAINALAVAAQGGDLEALTQLGRRLVIGDRAPLLPREGFGFLMDALQRGSAEAALVLAPLAALGAHTTQSWNDALRLLIIAAERGSPFARAQLTVLSTDARLAHDASGSEPQAGVWRQLAQSVDVAAWSVPPPGESLHASPDVRVFPELAPANVCAWLIQRARGRLKRAQVYDPAARNNIEDRGRTNSVAEFSLIETDLVQAALQTRMAAACGLPLRNMEAPAVLHYEVGEEIVNHYDFVDPGIPNYEQEIASRGERAITFLVYLNDDYEGGTTHFPTLGLTHRGQRGEGLYFVNALPDGKPDTRMLHAGRPPTRGEKWIVSQFIRNRATLPSSSH